MLVTSVSTDGDGVVRLVLGGVLDATTVAGLRADAERVLSARPQPVQLDLTDLTMIDSSGVAALLSLYKRVRAQSRAVDVIGLRDQPLEIFRLLRPGSGPGASSAALFTPPPRRGRE